MSENLAEIAEDSARGGFFLFTGNFLSYAILAIGSIIIGRLLGPENFGLYSLSLVVPSLLAGLIDLGVNTALTRYLAKLRAEGKSQLAAKMLKSGFLFKIATGTAMSALCYVFADFFAINILNRPEMDFLVKTSSFLIIFQTILTASDSSFTGLDKMQYHALTLNIQAIMKTTLSPLLVFLGFSVVGALAGHITSYLVASLAGSLLLLNYYKTLEKPSNSNTISNLRVLLSYGFPIYVAALLILLLGQYQNIILAFFASDAEIGNFNVAITLTSLVNVLILPLGALLPAFAKINPKSKELGRVFKLAVKYASLLIIPATLVVVILATDIVNTFYGQSYDLAPSFLQLYVLTFLKTGLGSMVLGHLFNGIGENKVAFRLNLINLLSFLPLAPILIIYYNVPGLIIAYLTSRLFALAYGLFIAVKKFHVSPNLKSSLRIYLTSFLSAIPTLLFLHLSSLNSLINLIIGGSLFLLTYITITPLTGATTQTDIKNLTTILNKIKILWPIIKPILTYQTILLKIHQHTK